MSSRELLLINPDDIIYFKSDGNYCTIYFEDNKKIVLCKKLKEIEKELDDNLFFRVHKSYIINLNKVTSYIISDNLVMLNNSVEIPVSRMKKSGFLKIIE